MDEDLARHVASIAVTGAEYLKAADYALAKNCEPAELAAFRAAFAGVDAKIRNDILAPIYAAHPNVKTTIETGLATFGAVL
ncbi:MAG TPA: hypothetical protein VEU47_09675 [Candidatus Cybelea sp.]|nr:hypothetical protein [Candidatus Cybelea sp.]